LKTQQQPLLEEISKGVMTKDLEAKIKAVRTPLPSTSLSLLYLTSLTLLPPLLFPPPFQTIIAHVKAFTE